MNITEGQKLLKALRKAYRKECGPGYKINSGGHVLPLAEELGRIFHFPGLEDLVKGKGELSIPPSVVKG